MEKICLNCEQIFETDSTKKKFCSDKCKMAFSRRKKSLTLPPAPKPKTKNFKFGKFKIPVMEVPGMPDNTFGIIQKGAKTIEQLIVLKKGGVMDIEEWSNIPYPGTSKTEDVKHEVINNFFDHDKINKRLAELSWVKKVEEYCNQNGCTPDDLIELHKLMPKGSLKIWSDKEVAKAVKDINTVLKSHEPVNKRKEYNPFNNPVFNIKTPSSKAKT